MVVARRRQFCAICRRVKKGDIPATCCVACDFKIAGNGQVFSRRPNCVRTFLTRLERKERLLLEVQARQEQHRREVQEHLPELEQRHLLEEQERRRVRWLVPGQERPPLLHHSQHHSRLLRHSWHSRCCRMNCKRRMKNHTIRSWNSRRC